MATDLRLILLVIGSMVVLGLFLDGVCRRKKKENVAKLSLENHDGAENLGEAFKLFSTTEDNGAPPETFTFDGKVNEACGGAQGKGDVSPGVEEGVLEEERSSSSQTVLSLTILPRDRKGFLGGKLAEVLKSSRFHFGQYNVFHQHVQNDVAKEVVCSLASLVEPGSFSLETYRQQTYPGLSLFMMVPTHQNPMISFEKMLLTGKQLATALKGELCDDKRAPLTIETLESYRGKIRALGRERLAEKRTNTV